MKLTNLLNESDDPFEPISMRDTKARHDAALREQTGIGIMLVRAKNQFHSYCIDSTNRNLLTLTPEEAPFWLYNRSMNARTYSPSREVEHYIDVRLSDAQRKRARKEGRSNGWVYVPVTADNLEFREKIEKLSAKIRRLSDQFDECVKRRNRLFKRLEVKLKKE